MKKIKNRAYFALLIALALVAGTIVYIIRLWNDGGDWVMLRANRSVFSNGVLDVGEVTDRNGVILARAGDGVYAYAEDEAVRRACLHAVGDYEGNIGAGALNVYAKRLAGYSFWNGTNSIDGKGKKLALTIDSRAQVMACNSALDRGAIMVMNYETGEVLCMMSAPSFDPAVGYDSETDSADGVYINRCLNTAYVPGSVFKIVTLAAAIENIEDLDERRFPCAGSVIVGGELITCTDSHGEQTIEEAFANSCNCAFSELTQQLGGEILNKYAKDLGLIEPLEVGGVGTAGGRYDLWSEGSGSLSWSGIGQSTDMVTPVAMLRLCAAIAAGGTVTEPRLLMSQAEKKTQLLSEETAAKLREMMNYNVVYAYEGASPLITIDGVTMYAKTGTAEVGDGTSHAWFVGFIDEETQPLAFVVISENAGSGLAFAAPKAHAVLTTLLGG
ncbi:MAG: penicillin-binding protein [Oscillospiraceae bacterium]|nr:penicillin-binding protein [Oscillospiraceae bacterium]